MVMYFPRYLIGSTLTTCSRRSNEISGKVYAHVFNLFMREGDNIHITK